MNPASTEQAATDVVTTPVAVAPEVVKSEPAAATGQQLGIENPPASAAALKKGTPKAKTAGKPAAKNSKKLEVADQPMRLKKPLTEPNLKSDGDGKTNASAQPKAESPVKVKKLPPKKQKLMRDSFTLPESDYALFAILKRRALDVGLDVKKSELLRASLALLAKLDDAELMAAIGRVERIKTGRPKK